MDIGDDSRLETVGKEQGFVDEEDVAEQNDHNHDGGTFWDDEKSLVVDENVSQEYADVDYILKETVGKKIDVLVEESAENLYADCKGK